MTKLIKKWIERMDELVNSNYMEVSAHTRIAIRIGVDPMVSRTELIMYILSLENPKDMMDELEGMILLDIGEASPRPDPCDEIEAYWSDLNNQ
jgi:hypothetical protein